MELHASLRVDSQGFLLPHTSFIKDVEVVCY